MLYNNQSQSIVIGTAMTYDLQIKVLHLMDLESMVMEHRSEQE